MAECGYQRDKLTNKQELFCRLKAMGKTGADAYRGAFDSKAKDQTIYQKASILMATPKIKDRIKEICQSEEQTYLWTRNMAVMHLLKIVEDGVAAYAIGAIKELNVMHGFDKPLPSTNEADENPIGITVTVHDARKIQPQEIH